MDDEIISALIGSANTGKTGSTSVALPAAQKIAHGSAGLTIAKLVEAKQKLDETRKFSHLIAQRQCFLEGTIFQQKP